MKKLVLLDFDGTLADTSVGIINSHKYAHRMMKKSVPPDDVLHSVIGGPLLETYITRFGFGWKEAKEAIAYYRDFYASRGINEASLYDGIKELLEFFSENTILSGIATLKAERFAKIMAKNLGINQFFSVIHGMDENDKRTKAQIIERCMNVLNVSPAETLMIGDSLHDYKGAMQAGVNFVGVPYGFGFSGIDNDKGIKILKTLSDVREYIKSHM